MGNGAARHPPSDHGGSRTLTGLIKRSFSLAGHRTSVALETAFWQALAQAAEARRTSLAGLVAMIDADRDGSTPLASALRVFALREALASPSGTSRDIAEE
jgi:predicted DNA-binding ribbon-helix-helix protein